MDLCRSINHFRKSVKIGDFPSVLVKAPYNHLIRVSIIPVPRWVPEVTEDIQLVSQVVCKMRKALGAGAHSAE